MSDDFYPFVDSGDPAPDNAHITGGGADELRARAVNMNAAEQVSYATRIAIYDDMLSTPRVIVIAPKDVRTYLEEITNTVYRCMKEQGGGISLMVIREIVENFIHANFVEPIISILDDGNTIRFADQGPGIDDKERAFEFGVTSADRNQKRYIRGTGAGFPMVQQYLENAGGAVSIEDNLHQGTVVTVSIDPARAAEIERAHGRGAAVRGAAEVEGGAALGPGAPTGAGGQTAPMASGTPMPDGAAPTGFAAAQAPYPGAPAGGGSPWQAAGYPPQPYGYQQPYPGAGAFGAAGMPQGGGAAYPQPYAQQPYMQPYPPQPPAGQGYPAQPYAPYPAYQGVPPQGYPPAGPGGQVGAAGQARGGAPAGGAFVSERGEAALTYLAEHGSGGPTDLAHAYGSSAPTWSRELETLSSQGLVIKRGQKRFLTDAGRAHLASKTNQQ